MPHELDEHIFVAWVFNSELTGEPDHVLREERHPGSTVRLFQITARRQWGAAVENPDVVESEKATLENVLAKTILAVNPPCEVHQELVERPLNKVYIDRPVQCLRRSIKEKRRESMHRRVYVAEIPLIRRELTARVDMMTAQHKLQLIFGEIWINHRERNGVESEIPSRIPRVFSFVRHQDDVIIDHVEPLSIPEYTAVSMKWVRLMLFQPGITIPEIILLGPEHASEGLPHYVSGIW